MTRYTLTKNEAKILRAIGDYGEANIYELASVARLTPNDVNQAVEMLAKRDFIIYNPKNPILQITKEGMMARHSLMEPSYKSSQRRGSSVSIVSDAEAAEESSYNGMSSEQLDEMFTEEIKKLK